jgi:hypothetical protein
MKPGLGCSPPRAVLAGRAPVRRRCRGALLGAATAGLLLAAGRGARAADNATPIGCSDAAVQAERAWNLPAGLLGAIGRAESGRPDALTGRIEPSPFAINVAGTGYFFDSAAAAVGAVQGFQSGGVRSIDVGCFQINLLHHPAAFASLAAAFDPAANATAAAQFLSDLYQHSGDWAAAVALYHSALPERGEPYRARVFAEWHGDGVSIRLPRAPRPELPGGDPHVVLLAAAAARVLLVVPAERGGRAAPAGRAASTLPRVFVPE